MAVDPNIKKKADDIRNKVYGKEVRESLASGLEEMSKDVVENEGRQSVVESRQDSVESQWQNVVDETTGKDVISAPEIIAAQDGEANLKVRLDKENQEVTAQLAQTIDRIDSVQKANEVEPAFALIDDDATTGVLSILKPMLDSRGFKGSTAISTSRPGTNRHLSVDELKALNDKGWTILAHGHDHINLSTAQYQSEITREFTESKRLLESWGLPAKHYVLPGNGAQQIALDIGRKYYESIVGAYNIGSLGLHVNPHPLPTFLINRVGIGAYGQYQSLDDWDQVKAEIDFGIANKRLVVFMTHVLDDTPEQKTLLERALDYIKDEGYEVESYDEAFEKHRNIIEKGHFDFTSKRFEFAVGVDGTVEKAGFVEYNTPTDSIDTNTQPNFFENKSKYNTDLSAGNYGNIPVNVSGLQPWELTGRLVTTKEDANRKVRQFYFPDFEETIYYRKSKGQLEWGNWLVQVTQLATRPNVNASPAEYPVGTHTFSYSGNEEEIPSGGTLTTYKPHPTQLNYTYQILKESGSGNVKMRYWSVNNNIWFNWQEFQFV